MQVDEELDDLSIEEIAEGKSCDPEGPYSMWIGDGERC